MKHGWIDKTLESGIDLDDLDPYEEDYLTCMYCGAVGDYNSDYVDGDCLYAPLPGQLDLPFDDVVY